MTKGTVKNFNAMCGFGFNFHEDGARGVFVHISAIKQTGMAGLNEGQKVNFDILTDAHGPRAVNLQAD